MAQPRNRRVRCDLSRPDCDRCRKAGRICEGYRDSAIHAGAVALTVCSPLPNIQLTPTTCHVSKDDRLDVLRFTKLGCQVLHSGTTRHQGAATSFWRSMSQLGQADPLVGTSMAAFGAAVTTCLSPSRPGAVAYSRYCGFALSKVQQAIANSTNSSLSLIAACLLLAISEILMGQELPALSHLQGTLLAVQQRQKTARFVHSKSPRLGNESSFALNDEIDTAGAVLDIGVASYALGLEPRLPPLNVEFCNKEMSIIDEFELLERRVLKTLHSSYGFASKHNHWKYAPNRFVPKDIFISQNQICAELFQRIQEVGSITNNLNANQASRALVLRAQCSTCLIYSQMLLESLETGYDRFQATFSSIVEDAEVVRCGYLSQAHGSISFSLDLGVIQPLFFTAIKCRTLRTRLKAVNLLRTSGKEGPFDGKKLSIVAQRAAALETKTSSSIPDCGEEVEDRDQIPEGFRLHSAGIDGNRLSDMFAAAVPASFSRCRDVEALVEASTPDEYKDPSHWEMWDELLAG